MSSNEQTQEKKNTLTHSALLYSVSSLLLFMASQELTSVLPICSLVPNKSLRFFFLSRIDHVLDAWNWFISTIILRSQILPHNWDAGNFPQLEETQSTSIKRSVWPSATALHPFSLVFLNELGTQTQAVSGPQGRLLKMISYFIPEAESGLVQIIGMQAVMRTFSFSGQQEIGSILLLIKIWL